MGIPVLAIKALTGGGGGGSDPRVSQILEKIPAQATAQNQLADKDFVNSSIGTNTANYISNQGQPFTSVAQLPTTGVTNNDYAFVTGTDSSGNTYFDRYKATVSGSSVTWAKEYRLNNSSFTAEQWAAITSGITQSLVTKLSGMKGVHFIDINNDTYDDLVQKYENGTALFLYQKQGTYPGIYLIDYLNKNTKQFKGAGLNIAHSIIVYNTQFYIWGIRCTLTRQSSGKLGGITYAQDDYAQASSSIVTASIVDDATKLPTSKAVYDYVKAPTAFTCEMADGTTKTLTMNGVLS